MCSSFGPLSIERGGAFLLLATLTATMHSVADFVSTRQEEICGRQRFHRIIGLKGEFASNATDTLIGMIIKEEGIPSGGTPFRASRSTPAPPIAF